MAHILAVGIATLDIINQVDGFPAEDAEVRAVGQRLCRGGNATNTLTVLSQLGHSCHWAGVLADEPDARHIEDDLNRHAINTDAVVKLAEGKVPTSYITRNTRNGSRTIVHYRDLPEYSYADFRKIDLNKFDWIHFEGRNVAETVQMLSGCREHRPDLPCSVEIEKERQGIEQLLPLANVLLFSKPFAEGRGHSSAADLLKAIRPLAPKAMLVCTWGNAGAWALDSDNNELHSPAFVPAELVDTLGAGDTFNAGMIDACLQQLPPAEALASACRLAGRKCGHEGLDLLDRQLL